MPGDYPLVVVTPASGYTYCSCNWEYFLSVDLGGYCIVKDRAKSAARPRSCPHQLVSDYWVYYGANFLFNLFIQILKLR